MSPMDIFNENEYRQKYDRLYDHTLQLFQCPYQERYVATSYGETYVLCFSDMDTDTDTKAEVNGNAEANAEVNIVDTSKPPLVLLHGMTMSSIMWYPNVRVWAQHYSIYAIDIVGDIGKSVPNEAIMKQEEAVEWLKETVDGLGLTNFLLAGHSIGGYISLRFTLAHPERVAKLALYAPAAAFHRLHWKFFYYAFPGLLFQTEQWIDRAFRSFSTKGLPFNSLYHEFILAGYQHATPLLRLYPLKIDQDELRKLDMPILLMIGEEEIIYPAAQALKYAKAAIPHIQCSLVGRANHTLTLEFTDIVNTTTVQFFQGNNQHALPESAVPE